MKWVSVTEFVKSGYKGNVTFIYPDKHRIENMTSEDAYAQAMILYHTNPKDYDLDKFEFLSKE